MILHPRLMQLDFNLLKTLYVLVEVQSTVKAARVLHLSQPAVSKSLNKLRDYFKDELFTRQGNQLHPTSLTVELAKAMPRLQQALISVLVDPLALPAAEWEGDFSISAPTELLDVIALPISQLLAQITPNVRPMFRPINNDYVGELSSGKVNMVIMPPVTTLSSELYSEDIIQLTPYILCREGHPLADKKTLALEDLNPYPVYVAKSVEFNSSYLQNMMEKCELRSEIKGLYHSSVTAQQMVAITDGYSFACSRLQLTLPNIKLIPFNLPEQYQQAMQICVPRNMKNNANMQWFLEQIKANLVDYLSE